MRDRRTACRRRGEEDFGELTGIMMKPAERNSERFMREMDALRARVAELERAEIARGRAEAALDQRHRFEELITTISTNFINLPSEEIDAGIHDALRAICEFAGVDRAWVGLLSEDRKMWNFTHEWCADGIQPTLERIPQMPVDSIPWAMQQLIRKETIYIPRVADLPPEAKMEKEAMQALEVQSVIIVPMVCRESLVGAVSFDSVRQEKTWEKDDMALLRMVGEIFANALERKQTEQALREAKEGLERRVQERTREVREKEQKYRRLVEGLDQEYFFYRLNPDGVLTYVSPSVENVLGYNPDELYTHYLTHASVSPFNELGRQSTEEALAGKRCPSYEVEYQHKRGGICRLEILEVPVFDEGGKVVSVEGIAHDVTERARREEEVRVAREQAEQANRAKSRFLANMSHELRTPLNGILGYAQILKRDQGLNATQKNGIEVIQESGEHLLTLINDVLDLAKIEAEKLDLYISPLPLRDLLNNVVDIIRIRAEEKGLSFFYDPLPGLPTVVYGDEKRLRQILLNLLGNAVKFTDTGSVTFAIRFADDNPESHVLRFEVEDTGPGIIPDQLSEIFKPFQQIHDPEKQAEGTGLGLSISQKLVHLMGGDIQVASTVGTGSMFSVNVPLPPLVGESEWVATKAKPMVIGYEGMSKLILIVDDKQANRAVISNLLTPLGFRLNEAADGQECLIKAEAERPDLIVMDLVMPVMDGFEATRRIRKHPMLQDVPVIASSASVFEQDRQQSLNAGCTDFLAKPVKAELLFEKIAHHLGLRWVYDKETTHANPQSPCEDRPFVVPPREIVVVIFELAKRGKIFGIREQLTRVEQLDSAYGPFAGEARRFTKEYDMKSLCEFLQNHIDSSQ